MVERWTFVGSMIQTIQIVWIYGLKRSKLAKACFDFIQHRTDLDINGWSEQDIFKH